MAHQHRLISEFEPGAARKKFMEPMIARTRCHPMFAWWWWTRPGLATLWRSNIYSVKDGVPFIPSSPLPPLKNKWRWVYIAEASELIPVGGNKVSLARAFSSSFDPDVPFDEKNEAVIIEKITNLEQGTNTSRFGCLTCFEAEVLANLKNQVEQRIKECRANVMLFVMQTFEAIEERGIDALREEWNGCETIVAYKNGAWKSERAVFSENGYLTRFPRLTANERVTRADLRFSPQNMKKILEKYNHFTQKDLFELTARIYDISRVSIGHMKESACGVQHWPDDYTYNNGMRTKIEQTEPGAMV